MGYTDHTGVASCARRQIRSSYPNTKAINRWRIIAHSAYQKAGESRVVLDTPFDRQQRCRTAKNEYETADSAYLIYLPYTDILRPDHPSYLNVSAMSRKSITLTSVSSVVLIAVVATAFKIGRASCRER